MHKDPTLAAERESDLEENVHFGQVQQNLSLFDKLVSERDSTRTHTAAIADTKWFTNHVCAGFAENEFSLPYDLDQDF